MRERRFKRVLRGAEPVAHPHGQDDRRGDEGRDRCQTMSRDPARRTVGCLGAWARLQNNGTGEGLDRSRF